MAADMGLDPQLAMRPRMTLGYNVREKTEVAQILEAAKHYVVPKGILPMI